MRKVELNMESESAYEVIKKLVETEGNKQSACIKIGCTIRTVNRMIAGYNEFGKAFFVHGNTGRQPEHAIPEEVKRTVIDLYKNKYLEANFYHYTELLDEYEKINLSKSAVREVLMSENILSPKATKAVKKRVKEELEEKQKDPQLTAKEKKKIARTIVDIEDAHPRRPRSVNFGEVIQMDASLEVWFGDAKCQLHIAVDDSTNTIVAAYFDKEETLNGYYNLLFQILINYGIPYKFLTDRRTVFEYKLKANATVEDDTFTQFGYACSQLGTIIQTSSIPQAKGRVERMFETLQSRLPIELRLAGVTDIDSANEFLKSYLKKFNARFALPINPNKSVFEKQPSYTQINLTLAVISERTIDCGHCLRYDKKYFKTVDEKSNPVYHRKGTEAMVIKAFDGTLYATINDIVYTLEEVPARYSSSKNFDSPPENTEQKPKKTYIPPMSHPWKQASFNAFLKKQSHLKDKPA
jgi:hypothetical protein